MTLACCIAALFPTAARAEKVGDVEVNVQPLPSVVGGTSPETQHGYIEYRVQLRNYSTEPQIVHLSYPDKGGAWSLGLVASRSVRVAGGQVVLVSLYQPPADAMYGAMNVRVDGVRDDKSINVSTLPFRSSAWHSGPERPVVLLSRKVPQEFCEGMRTKIATKPAAPGPAGPGGMPGAPPGMGPGMPAPGMAPSGPETEPFNFLRSEQSVVEWSPNWLGYSCYDAIVVSGAEAEEMPPQVQLALRRYIECGGTLLVHAHSLPAAFSQGGTSDGKGGYSVGLGRAVETLDGKASDWEATYKKLKESPPHIYKPEKKPTTMYDLLVGGVTVPVRGLFVLVMLFGVGIGPANLWLLSRYKRRIWLWWNIPAISLLTCLLVFGYSVASEGLTGHGKTASITLLDERCHRATTIGYLSYYCPLTPAGPHFGVDTDVTLLENESRYGHYGPYGRRGDSTLRTVDWTNDQHLTSGWINARVPAYFQIRKNEDRRERLNIEKKADGSVKVVNALGADIERLYVANAAGRVFEGRNIPAGAERTLSAVYVTPAPGGGQTLLRNIFNGSEWIGGFQTWKESTAPGAMLSPGCYIAYLSKSPFVESPLEGVNSEDSVAIVYGISKGHDDGR
jgi:hypothetical protein